MVIWPMRISFGNNLTVDLLSYFLKIKRGKRMLTSLKDLAFCKQHRYLPNLKLYLCSVVTLLVFNT